MTQGAAVAVGTVDASIWSTNSTVNASEAAKTGISPSQDSNLEPRTSELGNSATWQLGNSAIRPGRVLSPCVHELESRRIISRELADNVQCEKIF